MDHTCAPHRPILRLRGGGGGDSDPKEKVKSFSNNSLNTGGFSTGVKWKSVLAHVHNSRHDSYHFQETNFRAGSDLVDSLTLALRDDYHLHFGFIPASAGKGARGGTLTLVRKGALVSGPMRNSKPTTAPVFRHYLGGGITTCDMSFSGVELRLVASECICAAGQKAACSIHV